jgi:hypothetical protein
LLGEVIAIKEGLSLAELRTAKCLAELKLPHAALNLYPDPSSSSYMASPQTRQTKAVG